MISAPTAMAAAVPRGPAAGRKVVPGIIKAPHPMMHPKARDHTLIGFRFF